MKKLFNPLASRRSFAKLLSIPMQVRLEQLEERRRVMFPKSSVFAVIALAAFVSLGALLFPQVVQAQCLFDCPNVGSDPSLEPWINSPQALDIAYCFDRDCVLNLKNGKHPIFSGNSIPTPEVSHTPSPPFFTGSGSPSRVFSCPGTSDVTISGTVVALLRNPTTGNFNPGSAAQARLNIIIKGVKCSVDSGSTILSRVLTVNPETHMTEPRIKVFDGSSSITILAPTSSTPVSLSTPRGWTGCTNDKRTGILSADCPFPLGIVEFENGVLSTALPATDAFPTVGEVYRAVNSTRFVGIRDCKGDANSTDPSTIACPVGEILTGGKSEALFTFEGNWGGAANKKINPKSKINRFDIFTPLFGSILPNTVTASANNGPEVPAIFCHDIPSHNRERCFFSARDLLPNGCTEDEPVAILVRGKLNIGGPDFRFVSKDDPICNTKSFDLGDLFDDLFGLIRK
jgi:hypothetical protein